jgi:hypothetical protein
MVGRPPRPTAGQRSRARSARLSWLALAAAPWPAGALAQAERVGPGPDRTIQAARAPEPPRIDGLLDDPAWRLTEPFDAFVQIFPDEGTAPSEPTEVRVLYDDRALYVAVRCGDSRPGEIVRPMGRRDKPPVSDQVYLFLDPGRGHQDGYAFGLTAGGILQDGVVYEDDRTSWDWDAVWDGGVTVDEGGWSAEFAIPLAILRFPEAPVQTWGFAVRRELARRRELSATVLIPRSARGLVSRLGHLTGMTDLRPRADLEVTPYAAARLAIQPQYSDPARPQPRLADLILDGGLDLKWVPSRSLSLVATLNPDFGQVEADEIIQNLTSYEIRFPEKRPFFNEGLQLFQPVGSGDDELPVPLQLFYSRRIGLETPIFGAAKLTSRLGETLQLSVLDALVAGGAMPAGSSEAQPARGMRWVPEQPLHLAPGSAYPETRPATENFLAGVLRWRASAEATLGATVTSALPFARECTAADMKAKPPPGRCDPAGGHAAALDWNLRTRDSEWAFYGQVAGSAIEGGPPARKLPDGVELHPGDTGFGAYAALRRQGGEPWRFDLLYEYESPKLDLNASGFLKTQNQQALRAWLRFVRPSLTGTFLAFDLTLLGEALFTTDDRGLARGRAVLLRAHARHESYTDFGCTAGVRDPVWDVREISESGLAYRRPPWTFLECFVSTDYSRPFALDLWASGGWFLESGPVPRQPFVAGEAAVQWRPHPRLETRLTLRLERSQYPARWVASDPDPLLAYGHLFADLDTSVFSAIVRQLVVLTPRLTFQFFAQLFTDSGRYDPRYCGASSDGKVRTSALVPYQAAQCPAPPAVLPPPRDFPHSNINLNAVLRWEYRLGSTLYAVYTRSQRNPAWDPASGAFPPATLAPQWGGPTVDTFMVKWSYWWNP